MKLAKAIRHRLGQNALLAAGYHRHAREAFALLLRMSRDLTGNIDSLRSPFWLDTHFDRKFSGPIQHLPRSARGRPHSSHGWLPKAIEDQPRNLEGLAALFRLGQYGESAAHMAHRRIRRFVTRLALGCFAHASPEGKQIGALFASC